MGALDRFLKNIFEPRSIGSTLGDPKRIKQRLKLIAGLLVDVPKGKLTKKTLGLLQDAVIDTIKESPFLREPHGSHTTFQSLGPGKFMIRSENPGHGFMVQFTPMAFRGAKHEISHAEFHLFPGPTPEEHEEFHRHHLPPIGKFVRDVGETVLRGVTEVQHFLELVEDAPEEVAKQLPRFGESPTEFFRRRREETGLPPRTKKEELWGILAPFIP